MLIREGEGETFGPYWTTFPIGDDQEKKISRTFVPNKDMITKADAKIWEKSQNSEKVDRALICFYDGTGYTLENGQLYSGKIK